MSGEGAAALDFKGQCAQDLGSLTSCMKVYYAFLTSKTERLSLVWSGRCKVEEQQRSAFLGTQAALMLILRRILKTHRTLFPNRDLPPTPRNAHAGLSPHQQQQMATQKKIESFALAKRTIHIAVDATDLALNPPESYFFIQDFLIIASGTFWLLAYLFYAIRCFRDRKCGLPLNCL